LSGALAWLLKFNKLNDLLGDLARLHQGKINAVILLWPQARLGEDELPIPFAILDSQRQILRYQSGNGGTLDFLISL
jgi:hypothetical protein